MPLEAVRTSGAQAAMGVQVPVEPKARPVIASGQTAPRLEARLSFELMVSVFALSVAVPPGVEALPFSDALNASAGEPGAAAIAPMEQE